MDEYHQYAGVAETIGVEVEFLTPAAGQGDLAALQHRWRRRRDPPSGGRLHPAGRPHPGAGPGRAPGRRRDLPPDPGHRHQPEADRRVAGADRQGRHHLAEHVVSATGNFARQTGAMVGLDVPVIPVEHQYIVTEPHPEIVGRHEQGLPEMGVLRESDGSWYLREEAGGLLLGPYEKGAPCCYLGRPARGCRIRAVRRRPRAPDAAHRGRDQPRAGVRRGRRQAGLQRRHPLYAGRQPDHRPGLGAAQFLAERGPQLRHHRGRRRRLAARGMDHRRRAHDRHAGGRPPPVRRLRDQGLSQGEERGGLRARLRHPLPGRGAPRRPAAADGALLRADEGSGCGVRPEVRLGAAELVRARGHAAGRRLVVPALEMVRARRRRVPERAGERGPARHDRVRQGTGLGPRRRGVSRPPGRQPPAEKNRPGAPLPRPQQPRRRALRVHHPARGSGKLLSGVGRRLAAARPRLAHPAHAAGRLGPVPEPHQHDGRPGGRRAQVARAFAAGERGRFLERRLPLADRPGDHGRPRPDQGAPGQFRRRAGVGIAPRARVPEPHLRCPDGRRRGPRPCSPSASAPWIP